MFNLIKMNLYSVVRTVSFWVMIAVTAVVAVFCVKMTAVDLQYMEDNQSAVEQQTDIEDAQGLTISYNDEGNTENADDNEAIGITFDSDEKWVNGDIDFDMLMMGMFRGGMIALIASIFIAIYTNAEQKTGYIKNIAGQLPQRGMLSLAKLVGIAAELLIMFAVFIVAGVICGKIVFEGRFVFNNIGGALKVIALQYLLHVAFGSIVMMLCTIARGSGIGMTVGIFYCSNMTSLIYTGINFVLNKLGIEKFDISKYDLMGYIMSANVGADSDTLTKCAIAGVIYIAVCTAVSMVIMQKRDIK